MCAKQGGVTSHGKGSCSSHFPARVHGYSCIATGRCARPCVEYMVENLGSVQRRPTDAEYSPLQRFSLDEGGQGLRQAGACPPSFGSRQAKIIVVEPGFAWAALRGTIIASLRQHPYNLFSTVLFYEVSGLPYRAVSQSLAMQALESACTPMGATN